MMADGDKRTFDHQIRSLHDQSELRRRISDFLSAVGIAEHVASDVILATSELVTNALEHGDASLVEVCVAAGDTRIHLEVLHEEGPDADDLAVSIAAPGRRGRGLQIVAAVAVAMATTTRGPQRRTTASFSASRGERR